MIFGEQLRKRAVTMSLVAYASSDENGDSDVDATDNNTSSTDLKLSESGTLKLNTKVEKTTGKIKVPAFALSTFESDDEEEQRSAKKPKIIPSTSKSGLFSFLPPPKSSANGKIANRTLIPHSVAKLKDGKKPDELPKTGVKPASSVTAKEDSDDDLEIGDAPLKFFSLGEQKDFAQDAVSGMEDVAAFNPSIEPAAASSVDQNEMPAGISYDPADYEDMPMVGPTMPDESVLNNEPIELNDEILLKLQGKRKHKQEEINIIDVSQDDQKAETEEWLMKSLSEEKASHGHRFRSHAPTSQQRRKHQITYLAFQAKERELELKNQWAENRLTRRQTQSKYGF